MKLYLAGPMRGYPQDNHPAFSEAADKLRLLGFEVHSPHEHDANGGFTPEIDSGTKAYMKYDLPKMLDQDAIVVLPGWQKSTGASIEVYVAQACGMHVFTLEHLLSQSLL